jgi:hypothetical protein
MQLWSKQRELFLEAASVNRIQHLDFAEISAHTVDKKLLQAKLHDEFYMLNAPEGEKGIMKLSGYSKHKVSSA